MLDFVNVTYKYDNEKALDNVSFSIKKGEFAGIIGHTGSGKSTLLQIVNGLLKPDAGQVIYNGKNIFESGYDLRGLKFDIGLVFQYPEYQLFESTVLRDVAYGPVNKGLTGDKAVEEAKNALKMVGIEEDKFEKSPFELSGGEKKRVAIAGILAMKPEILALDEPVAGLDPASRINLFEVLNKLNRDYGVTIVMISHSMEDMAEYANHIIVMDEGKVAMDGRPEEIFSCCRDLEKIGLAAPEVTYLMEELYKRGMPVDKNVIKLEEALKCLETLL